jgi:aminoglycoside phosphotransferase (APT) family kinase protein
VNFIPLPRRSDEFQQAPTAADIAALTERLLGLEVVIAEALELGGGAFNNAFRLTANDGRRWVLRLAPPPGHPLLYHNEHGLLRREHAMAPWLAAIAPWLPRVAGVDFTGQITTRDAILSDFIEGENWHAAMPSLTASENDALWRELAGLLRCIHATPAAHFGYPHPEPAYARWSDFMLGLNCGLLADLSRLGLPDAEARAWFALAERCAPALDAITTPRVLHGDPWPRNVLIRRASPADGGPRIVALLDHERGLFGDPMAEWVFHACDFPPVFWEAYGPRQTDPASSLRAAVYRGMIHVQCILEVPRYGADATAPRQLLNEECQLMQSLLAKT